MWINRWAGRLDWGIVRTKLILLQSDLNTSKRLRHLGGAHTILHRYITSSSHLKRHLCAEVLSHFLHSGSLWLRLACSCSSRFFETSSGDRECLLLARVIAFHSSSVWVVHDMIKGLLVASLASLGIIADSTTSSLLHFFFSLPRL